VSRVEYGCHDGPISGFLNVLLRLGLRWPELFWRSGGGL